MVTTQAPTREQTEKAILEAIDNVIGSLSGSTQRHVLNEYTKQIDEEKNQEEEQLRAFDELSNGPLNYWTPEEIRALKKELEKRNALEEQQEKHPEFKTIHELFNGGLSDREKTICGLFSALLNADNNGNDSGKYLNNIFHKTYNSFPEHNKTIIKNSKDAQLRELALLSETIRGMAC